MKSKTKPNQSAGQNLVTRLYVYLTLKKDQGIIKCNRKATNSTQRSFPQRGKDKITAKNAS